MFGERLDIFIVVRKIFIDHRSRVYRSIVTFNEHVTDRECEWNATTYDRGYTVEADHAPSYAAVLAIHLHGQLG